MGTDRVDYERAPVAWSCARKKGYADEKVAKKVAGRINNDEGRIAVVVYACRHCGMYHIGRAPAER